MISKAYNNINIFVTLTFYLLRLEKLKWFSQVITKKRNGENLHVVDLSVFLRPQKFILNESTFPHNFEWNIDWIGADYWFVGSFQLLREKAWVITHLDFQRGILGGVVLPKLLLPQKRTAPQLFRALYRWVILNRLHYDYCDKSWMDF
jgi:hypothetical protein